MDLVTMLTSVQFAESRRGFDRDEVAAFLQQVAKAVQSVESQLHAASARAERAEARALDNADDMSLRNVLVLAQRTADAAVAEAAEQARSITAAADQQASNRVSEAQAHAERTRAAAEDAAAATVQAAQARANQIINEAKAEAVAASDELRARLRLEVDQLESVRDTLRTDVTLLEAHMDEQRTRLQGALGALQMVMDHPDALRRKPIPAASAVHIPPPTDLSDVLAPANTMPMGSRERSFSEQLDDADPEIQLLDDEIDLRANDPITSPVPVISGEVEASFFEQNTFADERWKPRRERSRRR
jgi:DivIVA domain-containing protein